jgi:hypothetical protein
MVDFSLKLKFPLLPGFTVDPFRNSILNLVLKLGSSDARLQILVAPNDVI